MIGYDLAAPDDVDGLLRSKSRLYWWRALPLAQKAALGSLVLLGSAAIVPCFVLLGGQPALPSFGGVFRAAADSAATQWHGVSLGGWLVMEINPSKRTPTSPMDLRPLWMYDQIEGNSELDFITTLRREHGDAYAIATMRNHWEGYITEAAIDEAKALGVDTMRIPVGYWITDAPVGGSSPLEYGISPEGFVTGGLNHLQAMLVQLKKRGIGALVDVHAHACNSACVSDGMYCATPLAFGRLEVLPVGATSEPQVEDVAVGSIPRCASADPAGGPYYASTRTAADGAATWGDVAVQSVGALAAWVAALPEEAQAVVAYQLANEPALGPASPAVTAGINAFYKRAAAAARKHLRSVPLVLSWISPVPEVFAFLKGARATDAAARGGGVIGDHHYYLNWQGWMLPPGETMSWAELTRRACALEAEYDAHILDLYTAAEQDVIIGEWSLATNMDAPLDLADAETIAQLRRLYQAQLSAFGRVARIRGAFFWTLRMGSGWDPRPTAAHPKGRQLPSSDGAHSLPGYPFRVWSLLEMARLGVATALDAPYEDACA